MLEIFNGKPYLFAESFLVLLVILVWVTFRYFTVLSRCRRDHAKLSQITLERDGWRRATEQAISLAEDGTEHTRQAAMTLEALQRPEGPYGAT